MHEATSATPITGTIATNTPPPTHLCVAQFLARYGGATRTTYAHRIRIYLVPRSTAITITWFVALLISVLLPY